MPVSGVTAGALLELDFENVQYVVRKPRIPAYFVERFEQCLAVLYELLWAGRMRMMALIFSAEVYMLKRKRLEIDSIFQTVERWTCFGLDICLRAEMDMTDVLT